MDGVYVASRVNLKPQSLRDPGRRFNLARMGSGELEVLLVEDDARLGSLVEALLGQNGMRAKVVGDGTRALDALRQERFDVVVLDLGLPGIGGLEVCRRIRADPRLRNMPIVIASARGDDVDKIVGLELGADDYLAKPYNPRELVARIRAVMRRARPEGESSTPERLAVQDLVIDVGAHTLHRGTQLISLTFFEHELLLVLMRSAGRVLARDQLYDTLKGEAFETFDRAIDVHVSKLRQKLGDDPKSPRYIKTVRGVGYVFAKDPPP